VAPHLSSETVSSLMAAFRAGDADAAARLVELFHPELKRLAAGHLRREREGHSWQPTLLVMSCICNSSE